MITRNSGRLFLNKEHSTARLRYFRSSGRYKEERKIM
jgi:hypothetical protein